MADEVKITELISDSTPALTDITVSVDLANDITKKVTWQSIYDLFTSVALSINGFITTSDSYRFEGTYTFTSGIAAIGIASSGSMLIQGSQTNAEAATIIFVGQNGSTLGEIYNDSSRTTELAWISTSNNIRLINNTTSSYQTTIEQNNTGLFVGHNSSVRNLALQTDSKSRIIISGEGIINLPSITTSPEGLSSGDIWSNSGVLTIV
jgi:hypothetical protein